MRFKSVAATAAAFTIAAMLFASPATAAQSGITATDEGAPSQSDNSAVMAQLETLAETQSAAQVEEILAAGGPVQSLYDVDTNEYIAAYVEDRGFSTLAITPRGPGCATTDACANSNRGFYGSGQLTFSSALTGVTTIAAGNLNTTWWRTGTTGINQSAGATANLTSAVSLVSITRS